MLNVELEKMRKTRLLSNQFVTHCMTGCPSSSSRSGRSPCFYYCIMSTKIFSSDGIASSDVNHGSCFFTTSIANAGTINSQSDNQL